MGNHSLRRGPHRKPPPLFSQSSNLGCVSQDPSSIANDGASALQLRINLSYSIAGGSIGSYPTSCVPRECDAAIVGQEKVDSRSSFSGLSTKSRLGVLGL